jgi:translation initiation factor 2B subunit (eIF-2B alpha/beta/delta family)
MAHNTPARRAAQSEAMREYWKKKKKAAKSATKSKHPTNASAKEAIRVLRAFIRAA